MTNLMQTYYEQAQLSDAAYAVLAKGGRKGGKGGRKGVSNCLAI